MKIEFDDIMRQIHNEIEQIPEQYRLLLLKLVRSFREGIEDEEPWPSAADSFRSGWRDIKAGRVNPVGTLWDGIDVE
ncbi:MAG: hypothetical protein ACR2PR_04910 [Pseudohongiellaceae bacterium]